MNAKLWFRVILMGLMLSALVLAGCDDGDDGRDGKSAYEIAVDNGFDGTEQEWLDSLGGGAASTTETCTLCHSQGSIAAIENYHVLDVADQTAYDTPLEVTINGVTVNGATLEVDFTVPDTYDGDNAIPAKTSRLRFTFAELLPASLVVDLGDRQVYNGPDEWVRYAYQRPSTGGILTNNTGGNYTFNFNTAILPFDDITNVFRLAGQLTGSDTVNEGAVDEYDIEYPDTNWVVDYDFNGAVFTERAIASGRDIATTTACNACHERLAIHGGRYEYTYCVTCHNPAELGDVDGDMVTMIHAIHSSSPDEPIEAAGEEWEVTYPADLRECQKCHAGENAGLGLTRPYRDSCGSCHHDVNFATGEGHVGGAQADDVSCGLCHAPSAIAANHSIPEYEYDFTYIIDEVTVDEAGAPVVTFGINLDGTPITTCPPAGPFRGSPNFKVGYAVAAEGVDNPIDYNNYDNGVSAAQPVSIGLCDVFATATDNPDGTYTATLSTTFPDGAVLRTVGIDGYFYWTMGTADEDDDARQHTESAVAYVDGEERRMVVDNDKCLACHENLALHGGNRVNKVEMCVICHNPNLSSSGNDIDPTLPEDSQNMKDLVHGIHAAAVRTTDYEFARNFRGNANYYNWSDVTYPNAEGVQNCYICHNENLALQETQDGALASTVVSNDRSVPEDDENVSPITASCYYCHDADSTKSHMQQNGGVFDLPQSAIGQ